MVVGKWVVNGCIKGQVLAEYMDGWIYCLISRQTSKAHQVAPSGCLPGAATRMSVCMHVRAMGVMRQQVKLLATMQADALEPEQWREQLQGAVGVVSCLGGFGSNEFMLKVSTHAKVLWQTALKV